MDSDPNTLFLLYILFDGISVKQAIKHLNGEFINGVKVSDISSKVITVYYTSNSTDNNDLLATDLRNDCRMIKSIDLISCDDYEREYGNIDPDNQTAYKTITDIIEESIINVSEDKLIDYIRGTIVYEDTKAIYYLSKKKLNGPYSIDTNLFSSTICWQNVNSLLCALGAENMVNCVLNDVAISNPTMGTNFIYFNVRSGNKESLYKFMTILFLIENCHKVIGIDITSNKDTVMCKDKIEDSPQIHRDSNLYHIL